MNRNYMILKAWRNQPTDKKAKFAHIRKFDMSIPYYYSAITGKLLFARKIDK